MQFDGIELKTSQRLFLYGYDWALEICQRYRPSNKIEIKQQDMDRIIGKAFPSGDSPDDREALLMGINKCRKDLISWKKCREEYPEWKMGNPVSLIKKFYREPAKVQKRVADAIEEDIEVLQLPENADLYTSIQKVFFGTF